MFFSINIKNESDIVIKFENKVPWLHFKGKYAMEGKILLFPAVGKGNYYMNLSKLNANHIFTSDFAPTQFLFPMLTHKQNRF